MPPAATPGPGRFPLAWQHMGRDHHGAWVACNISAAAPGVTTIGIKVVGQRVFRGCRSSILGFSSISTMALRTLSVPHDIGAERANHIRLINPIRCSSSQPIEISSFITDLSRMFAGVHYEICVNTLDLVLRDFACCEHVDEMRRILLRQPRRSPGRGERGQRQAGVQAAAGAVGMGRSCNVGDDALQRWPHIGRKASASDQGRGSAIPLDPLRDAGATRQLWQSSAPRHQPPALARTAVSTFRLTSRTPRALALASRHGPARIMSRSA